MRGLLDWCSAMGPRRGWRSGWRRRGAWSAALVLGSAACGDPYIPVVFAGIELESGNLQTAKVCTALPEPLVVSAFDQFGDVQPGARIEFVAESGAFQPEVVLTDANGRARATYTLGSTPGSVRAVALAWHGQMSVEFEFTAEPDPPIRLSRVSGNNQSGPTGEPVANPLVVRVLDTCGVGTPDVVVTWSSIGGGQLDSDQSTTDEDGYARNALTLPPDPGVLTVRAEVEGLDPVVFTATAQAADGL